MISDETKARMRDVAAKYPSARSATLPALHIAQEAEGYVSPAGVAAVAETLGLRDDEVDSVVSFYSMYFKQPVGRHVIKVCTSISCYLRGCDGLLAHLRERLGIAPGETTADGAFTLLPTECLASCGTAPVLQVNNEFVENVTPADADALIERLRTRP
jgi:NADH-quinone oxidoreductase E subunit